MKNFTIEELRKMYTEAENQANTLKGQLEAKEREEAEAKQKQLAKEKDARRKAIEEKEKELKILIDEYVNDYGCYKSSFEDTYPWFFKFWF